MQLFFIVQGSGKPSNDQENITAVARQSDPEQNVASTVMKETLQPTAMRSSFAIGVCIQFLSIHGTIGLIEIMKQGNKKTEKRLRKITFLSSMFVGTGISNQQSSR